MDRNLRALQRRAGHDADPVGLAASYLRQGRADAALGALGEPPPPHAAEVLDQAWGELLPKLAKVATHSIDGRVRLAGVAAGHLLLARDDVAAHRLIAHWTLPASGDAKPRALSGMFPPTACTPRGLLVTTPQGPAWAAPPDWAPGEALDAPAPFDRPFVFPHVDPSGERAHWLRGLWTLPDLTPIPLPAEAEAARRARDELHAVWATDRVAWVVGENVLSQPLAGGPVARWKPHDQWRRQHPAQAAAAGRDALDLHVLADGRLCTTSPLAVHDPVADQTWFPNRGDGARFTGEPRLSHDAEALLVFRGGQPCRVPLTGTLPPRPTPTVAAGLWHPQAACALVRPTPVHALELRDTHRRVLFRFPHGLRPVCWCPDGRGVILQRELGAGAGPLEVWRLPETT